MIYCPECGAECPEDSVFCWNCGNRIVKHIERESLGSQSVHPKNEFEILNEDEVIEIILNLLERDMTKKALIRQSGLDEIDVELTLRELIDKGRVKIENNIYRKQKPQRRTGLSELKKAAIPLIVITILALIILVAFPGDPCRGITCDDECRGTALWKMKCVQGECVPDYIIERDSTQCGYEPPPSVPLTPEPSHEPELPGLIGWEGDVPIIDWRYVDQYYGQYVIIEGTIVDTYNSGNACFLNFHLDWERYFTAVIFASDFYKFPRNPESYYKGKKVRVRGIVQEYEGKPEIILEDPSQIEIIG